jgi:hypothetical protein
MSWVDISRSEFLVVDYVVENWVHQSCWGSWALVVDLQCSELESILLSQLPVAQGAILPLVTATRPHCRSRRQIDSLVTILCQLPSSRLARQHDNPCKHTNNSHTDTWIQELTGWALHCISALGIYHSLLSNLTIETWEKNARGKIENQRLVRSRSINQNCYQLPRSMMQHKNWIIWFFWDLFFYQSLWSP